MKLAAWLGGATAQCFMTFICILVLSIFFGQLQPFYWLIAMAVSAWWGGGKALVKYERELANRYRL